MESIEDYLVINLFYEQNSTPEAKRPSIGGARPAAMFFNNAQTNLMKNDCCIQGGWTNFPNGDDEEHSDGAHSTFLHIREKIQECRQRLSPPVTRLDLTGYKFQESSSDEKYSSYYFLRVHAGSNFHLYVKVGLTKEEFAPPDLLRLSSKLNRVVTE